jgi:hypothetical protein
VQMKWKDTLCKSMKEENQGDAASAGGESVLPVYPSQSKSNQHYVYVDSYADAGGGGKCVGALLKKLVTSSSSLDLQAAHKTDNLRAGESSSSGLRSSSSRSVPVGRQQEKRKKRNSLSYIEEE